MQLCFAGQGCHTSQAAVTDKHGEIIEWCAMGKTRRNSEKDLHLCHYVHHKSHIKSQHLTGWAMGCHYNFQFICILLWFDWTLWWNSWNQMVDHHIHYYLSLQYHLKIYFNITLSICTWLIPNGPFTFWGFVWKCVSIFILTQACYMFCIVTLFCYKFWRFSLCKTHCSCYYTSIFLSAICIHHLEFRST